MKNALTAVNLPAVGERQIPTDSIDFFDTIGASLEYKYSPLINYAKRGFPSRFAMPDEGYNARENIPEDLKAFGSTLLDAQNSEDMTLLTGQIRRGQETRRVMYESGFVANFAAELFDPVNYIALPFAAGRTFSQAALRTGVSTATIVSAQEAIRAPLDPLATKEEVALNIGSSFVLGGILGGAVSAPARSRVLAQERGAIEIDNLRKSIEQIDGVEIARPTSREESLKSAQAATTGSKVTNTVYHGSGNTGITTFESSGYTKGLYFSPRRDLAEDYMVRRGDGAGRVYEVMLDIKNPLIIKGSGKSLMDRIDIALGRKSEKDVRREGDERLTSSMILSEERIQELRGRGYDGIMNEDAMEYVAFDASQVHMVDGRSYSFSTAGGETKLSVVADQTADALTAKTSELDPNIAQSVFTDSWLFTGVTTPMKRILTDQSIPNSVKLRTLTIANDSGILLAGNKIGQKFGNSVFQEAKLHEGEWVGVYDELKDIWGQTTGKGVTDPLDYMPQRKVFNEWLAGIDEKAIRRTTPANELESRAIQKLNTFYENWEVRLRDEGMIGNQKFYESFVAKREVRLADIQKRLTGNLNPAYRSRLEGQLTRYADEIDQAKQTIQDLKDSGPITPPNEDIFRPRYWDFDSIRANREQFTQVLTDWFSANPSIYARNTTTKKFERIDLSDDAESISKRVNDMIDNLLDDTDPLNPDGMYYGMGKSKHMKQRTLDIPNELVLDFMVRNPVTIMKAYVSKTAARYEFSRKFNGDSIDDILDDTFAEMMDAGSTPEKAYAAMKDMRHLYDRIAGSVLRSPDSLDQKTATVMRDLAQLNYLGSAGISTITEPAKIIMEHGLGPTMKGLLNILTDSQLRMGAKELRIAGEALENLNGSAHMRLVDDLNNNPLRTTYMDKSKNAFYMLNGLGPITRIMKDFDGMMRSHTLIDYSVRWTQGKATKMEQEYLLRYNINLEDAQRIANAPWQKSSSGMYMANTDAWTNTIEFPSTTAELVSGPTDSYAPSGRYKPAFYRASENKIYIDEEHIKDVMWQERGWENPRVEGVNPIEKGIINSPDDYVTFIKMHEIMHTIHSAKSLGFDKRTKIGKVDYENAINDLATAEIKKQARVSPETVKTFRGALGSGVMNTILMGTPADKPIITDGIVYIPMRVAKQFGMKEDAAYTGYARIENGLLGLPFQFFSFALAAVNKTAAAYGHGQLKSQYIGTAIAMGLGYMTLQAKTPDYVEMSYSDQFARSFDYSGVAALYSDMFYTAMTTVSALGGPNITGDLLQPKFPQQPDAIDAATGLMGAGPSISGDLIRGLWEITTGNVGEGSKDVIRNLPFARLWFLKAKINEMTNMLEGELDGPSGFGRF